MASEDNEPVLRAMFSSSALDFNFTYAGISSYAGSNNIKCGMHLEEGNSMKDMELRSCMKTARGIYI